jgi:hypothetical protein
METSFKEQLTAKLKENESVIAITAVDNPSLFSAITDGFDLLLLIIARDHACTNQQFHYIKEGRRIQEKWVSPEALDEFILHGEHRNIIYWILKGEILLDRDTYLEGLRHRVLEFPEELREHKLLIEFSKFLRSYLQTKEYISEDHQLDAYNNILEALHHWARIVIVEAGYHPEVTVWRQVKQINPGVYKLYEELTYSKETIEQRVQLVLLACEFSVVSKMERCCKLLLEVLSNREEPWSMQELQELPKLSDVRMELPLLLNKLIGKSLAREVVYALEDDLSLMELRYTL